MPFKKEASVFTDFRPKRTAEALRSSGEPLPTGVRRKMESQFHHDFGLVRVHSGRDAEDAAESVDARAFTVGNDIVLGKKLVPATPRYEHVIAHELAHVVQQGGASSGSSFADHDDDQLEREAGVAATRVVAGEHAQIRAQGVEPHVQRQKKDAPEPAAKGDIDCPPDKKAVIERHLAEALRWTRLAHNVVQKFQTAPNSFDIETRKRFMGYFKFNPMLKDENKGLLAEVERAYAAMEEGFTGGVPIVCDNKPGLYSVSGVGGCYGSVHAHRDLFRDFTGESSPAYDYIGDVKGKAAKNERERVRGMVHEMAHKYANRSYGRGCSGGKDEAYYDVGETHSELSASDAVNNADSYARFAQYIAIGRVD